MTASTLLAAAVLRLADATKLVPPPRAANPVPRSAAGEAASSAGGLKISTEGGPDDLLTATPRLGVPGGAKYLDSVDCARPPCIDARDATG